MGSCYSVHNLLDNNKNKKCLICWEEIKGEYIKCNKCKILLHINCGVKYKNFKNYDTLKCPHCQYCGHSYLYTSDDLHYF